MTPKKIPDDKLLKLKEVLAIMRISKSTWYEGVDRKIFPQAVRIGTRSVFWWQSDIQSYLRDNYGGPDNSAA